jgi:hypothetical protein
MSDREKTPRPLDPSVLGLIAVIVAISVLTAILAIAGWGVEAAFPIGAPQR